MIESERAAASPDFTFGAAGGAVRVVALSDRALAWFWGESPPELREYFHYRRYGDTPFGWYTARWDDGFEQLLTLLEGKGFRIEGP